MEKVNLAELVLKHNNRSNVGIGCIISLFEPNAHDADPLRLGHLVQVDENGRLGVPSNGTWWKLLNLYIFI